MTTSQSPDLYAQAEARVNRKLGFMIHAAVYVLVNLGLYVLAQQRDAHWNIWPLMGWGVGLFFHAMGTWLSLSRNGWRQRMVNAEAAKLRGQR